MRGRGKARTVIMVEFVQRHSPFATYRWGWGDFAVAYTGGPCPRLTVYRLCMSVGQLQADIFRRSVWNDTADQALVACKLLDDNGRAQLLPELWDRCQRRRRNRDIPFWSPLKGESNEQGT